MATIDFIQAALAGIRLGMAMGGEVTMVELSTSEFVMLNRLGEGYNFYHGQFPIDDNVIVSLEAKGLVAIGTFSQAISWPNESELEIRPISGSVVKITSQGLRRLKERATT